MWVKRAAISKEGLALQKQGTEDAGFEGRLGLVKEDRGFTR